MGNIKGITQGKMIRFKHVQNKVVRENTTLDRIKYLFLPKEHYTLLGGSVMPFANQLMIRLSAQYHPRLSTLGIRVAHVRGDSLAYDTERFFEFPTRKALRTFVKRMAKRIQGFKNRITLTLWAKSNLFVAASKAGTGRTKMTKNRK